MHVSGDKPHVSHGGYSEPSGRLGLLSMLIWIVAGERRWLALKHLVSKGYKEFEMATSKLTTPQDADEEQVATAAML